MSVFALSVRRAARAFSTGSIPGQHQYDALVRNLAPQRQALVQHKLYGSIQTRTQLQTFMASHVFAVWDFMSLVKTLQLRLAPTNVPWTPPNHAYLAGVINDIVAAEESDHVPAHLRAIVPTLPLRASHLTLYREAMHEVGEDGYAFERFLDDLVHPGRAGLVNAHQVLVSSCLPDGVAPFCELTLSQCEPNVPTHQVAAAFLFGREDPIPHMFQRLLAVLGSDPKVYPFLRFYLERHIELDGDEHANLGRDMLCLLCGDNDAHWDGAEIAARNSIEARVQLWDAIQRRL